MKPDNLKRNIDSIKKSSSYVNRFIRPVMKKATFSKHDPEVEFKPAVLEMLETPPSPAGRATALLICLFFSLALVWAYFGKIDIVATATGKIVPSGLSKTIQPLEAGVVKAIHVQDGQEVKAGDTLIEIDSTISQAEQDRLKNEMITEQLEAARLTAALKISDTPLADFIAPQGATQAQLDQAKSQLVSQVQEIKSKLSGLDSQITQNEGNMAAVQATIDGLNKTIPIAAQRFNMYTSAAKGGAVSKADMLDAQKDLVDQQQKLREQKGRLTEASGSLNSLKGQRQEAESDFKQKTLDLLAQAQQKANSSHDQLVQATEKNREQTLTAPVDGTVQQLVLHTVGGVVTPAQALMTVVPTDSKLEIQATIANKDIAFVNEGQNVAVKVDAINFTQYGMLHGTILSISQDAVVQQKPPLSPEDQKKSGAENESSEPKGQELVYMARIALDKTQMQIGKRLVHLSPGMAVTVEVNTGKRRILEYFLSPIFKDKEEALHER
jgi:hemolysin D